jgi:hypothetical protein
MAPTPKKLIRIVDCTHLMVVLKFRWKNWLLHVLLAAESGVDDLSYCRGSTLSICKNSITFIILIYFLRKTYTKASGAPCKHHHLSSLHLTSPINPTRHHWPLAQHHTAPPRRPAATVPSPITLPARSICCLLLVACCLREFVCCSTFARLCDWWHEMCVHCKLFM